MVIHHKDSLASTAAPHIPSEEAVPLKANLPLEQSLPARTILFPFTLSQANVCLSRIPKIIYIMMESVFQICTLKY